MSLIVQKYGGTSVGTLDHIRSVARHIAETLRLGNRVVVTISAMGEQTDELLAMAYALAAKPPRRELDMLMTAGERISASLLAVALHENRIPSVSLTGSQSGILTDETHGNARVHKILGDRIKSGLAEGKVVIVAGFQGMSLRTKEITTLGRGGTDLSAIALAAALKADRCQLYKDVNGVYTADPRLIPTAKVLGELSFETMNELAWSGATVLHTRGAHLAAKYAVPFEIRSSLDLAHPGTLIRTLIGGSDREMESPKVDALAHKTMMSLLACRVVGTGARAHTIIAAALDWFWQQGEAPALSQQERDAQGHIGLTLVVKSHLVPDFQNEMQRLAVEAGGRCDVIRQVEPMATITIVGAGFQQSPETIAKVCDALPRPPLLIDTRNTAITVCVEADQLQSALSSLHDVLISPPAP